MVHKCSWFSRKTSSFGSVWLIFLTLNYVMGWFRYSDESSSLVTVSFWFYQFCHTYTPTNKKWKKWSVKQHSKFTLISQKISQLTVSIYFAFRTNWFRKWCKFSWTIKSRSKTKPTHWSYFKVEIKSKYVLSAVNFSELSAK